MNKKSKMIIYIYVAILLLGGAIGFFKSGSMMSVLASIFFSALLLCCQAFIKGKKESLISTVITLVVLDSFFAYRYALTNKFMPAGIMSLVTFVFIVMFMKSSKKA